MGAEIPGIDPITGVVINPTDSPQNNNDSANPQVFDLSEDDDTGTDTFSPSAKKDAVTVQKWGSAATDGNTKPNDCLWNIATNFIQQNKLEGVSHADVMNAIMAANPQIYGDDVKRGSRTGSVMERWIYDGETMNLPDPSSIQPTAQPSSGNTGNPYGDQTYTDAGITPKSTGFEFDWTSDSSDAFKQNNDGSWVWRG